MKLKTVICATAVAGLLALPTLARAEEDERNEAKVAWKDLPSAVKQTIKDNAEGGTITGVEMQLKAGKVTFEAEIKTRHGKTTEVIVSLKGKRLQEDADEEGEDNGKAKAGDDDDDKGASKARSKSKDDDDEKGERKAKSKSKDDDDDDNAKAKSKDDDDDKGHTKAKSKSKDDDDDDNAKASSKDDDDDKGSAKGKSKSKDDDDDDN